MKHSRLYDNKKIIGRPRTGVGTLVGQRWHDADLEPIDNWRAKQPDLPSRAEAIRRLVGIGLAAKDLADKPTPKPGSRAKRGGDASDMAGNAIDGLGDNTATDDQRASRKRRLLKGPMEFREMRRGKRPA